MSHNRPGRFTPIPQNRNQFTPEVRDRVAEEVAGLIALHRWRLTGRDDVEHGFIFRAVCGYKRLKVYVGSHACSEKVDIEVRPGGHSQNDVLHFLNYASLDG